MKTLVGVDLGGNYLPALQLALDLGFPEQRFVFVHVVEPIPAYAPPMGEGGYVAATWMTHLREAGTAAVARAEALVRSAGKETASFVEDGTAKGCISEVADREGVDLIAVGSATRGLAEGTFLGSVAK